MNEYTYPTKTTKAYNINPSKLIILITTCIGILGIIFFLSFYISYNKISADRKINRSEKNTINEQAQVIEQMKNELSIKDEQIEELKAQLEKKEAQINDIKASEEYSKMIADELKSLPKETRIITPTTPKTESANTATQPKQSDVQKDIYIKAQ
ncbi:hypothetical protein [Petroclostridium sp. X23]|uniref:hypothetical protein n=1 Tax=Petroclostridium sp. X23 TaxID=3045146 RepID=UPI0024AE4394|nr:hypothetical protein [Petroclostridium sp. X23]WHH57451.1 hypothetical protein QKW49_16640 [Petroclostridium sp. X23]